MTSRLNGTRRRARRFEVHGTVQGVGFRPYVYRLATGLGLDGWVRNAGGHVVIEAAGEPSALIALAERLPAEAPLQAAVSAVHIRDLAGRVTDPGAGFRVLESESSPGAAHDFPPDLATCDDCLRELFDPADRRYRYPFVNCTNCGPRATIIADLPYDRGRTTMAAFDLCPECAAEYADPADRRFHAEPTACPACGPRLAWVPDPRAAATATHLGSDALGRAVELIASGGIVALKGLGGYQLVCDATNASSVARLRARKHRPAKPFAVMVRDLERARSLAGLSPEEERLLGSVARPIVLVTVGNRAGGLPADVHPGTDHLGLFLPYTPLHHLLLHDLDRPLVVTSGNLSDEPIAIDDADALDRLGRVADGFLLHDREIRARFDDSVARVAHGRASVVRRARGYAPEALRLPRPARQPLLAAGAQLKHTFALAAGDRVVVSPHLGDLSDQPTFEAFERGLEHLSRLEAVTPEYVAHDLHAGYLSTQFVRRWPADRRLPVQHHHAHLASCAAEHGLTDPFIGIAYDGLGLGDDGTLWGGEVLIADLTSYRRWGRFGRAPLPGGEAAVRRPARMALGYLFGAEDLGHPPAAADADLARTFAARLPDREVETVRRMVARGVNSPVASSAGRLFDAASSLLGLRDDATYEGEAAVVLEAAARSGESGDRPEPELPWRLVRSGGLRVYDPAPTLAGLLAGLAYRTPVEKLAASFHSTITAVTVTMCVEAAEETGLRTVCLSGGVFQNHLLTTRLLTVLRERDLDVYVNESVPTNDGGVSYGQAAVAAARMGKE